MRCPEQHTKSPKKSYFFPLLQNKTLYNESIYEIVKMFVLQVSLEMNLNMQMSYTLFEYAQNTP